MSLIMGDCHLQCFHFVKWSWICVVLHSHLRRDSDVAVSWRLVAVFRHSAICFGRNFVQVLIEPPLQGRLSDAHYQRFGKYIWKPGRKVIPNYVWQQLHALKMGVRNGAKIVIILKFCFLQPTRNKMSSFWNFVSCNQHKTHYWTQVSLSIRWHVWSTILTTNLYRKRQSIYCSSVNHVKDTDLLWKQPTSRVGLSQYRSSTIALNGVRTRLAVYQSQARKSHSGVYIIQKVLILPYLFYHIVKFLHHFMHAFFLFFSP